MTSDAVRELEEKNEALRTRIVTAHAERDSALALVHARTVNLDAMRTDRDAAVKRAEDAEASHAAFVTEYEREFNAAALRAHDLERRLAAAQEILRRQRDAHANAPQYERCTAPTDDDPREGRCDDCRGIDDALSGNTAALDAALVRAREEMRDAAVKVCADVSDKNRVSTGGFSAGGAGAAYCAERIASLPTTGGGR